MTLERWGAAVAAATLLMLLALHLRRAHSHGTAPVYTVTCFLTVWGVSLALFAVPWIEYTTSSWLTWLVIYGSIGAFLAGALGAVRTSSDRPGREESEQLLAGRVRIAWIVSLLLGLVGFMLFVRAIDTTVGWKALLEAPSLARSAQKTSDFEAAYGLGKALTYLTGVSVLLWTLALREGFFRGRWRLVAGLQVLVLFPYFFSGERLSLLTALTWVVAFHLIWRPIGNLRRLVIPALAVGLCVSAYFYVIASQKDATIYDHPEIQAVLTSRAFEPVALPLLYMTANVPTLDRVMHDPIAPTSYGQLLALPIVKLAHSALPIEGVPPKDGDAFYPIPFTSYNSDTWLGTFYRDFGVIGCILLSALAGFATTFVLLVARARRTFLATWFAAVGLGAVVFSPLKNQLPDANTWELILLGPLVSAFVRTPKPAVAGGTSFRTRLDQLRGHRMLVAASLTGTVAVVAIVASGSTFREQPDPGSFSELAHTLRDGGRRLAEVYEAEGGAASRVVVSQLEVSDPGNDYEELSSPDESPSASGVVGVLSNTRGYRLRGLTDQGVALEVVGVRRGPNNYVVIGPRRVVTDTIVANGGFESGFLAPWVVSRGDGVDVALTTKAHRGAYALSLHYNRDSRGREGTLSQLVQELPIRSKGTRYTLREAVLRRTLSRQVVVGFQFIYRDGTSEYVAGGTRGVKVRSLRRPSGILEGSSDQWDEIVASAVATRPVTAIRVFALDTGRQPLSGRLTVDSVSLTAERR